MQAHRKQISAIKLTMNMAKHGAKGLNIFRSHRKNSYTTVSVSFFGLPAVQSSRDTRGFFMTRRMLRQPYLLTLTALLFISGSVMFHQGTALAVVEEIAENRIREITPLLSEKPAGFGLPISKRSAWEDLAENESFKKISLKIQTLWYWISHRPTRCRNSKNFSASLFFPAGIRAL